MPFIFYGLTFLLVFWLIRRMVRSRAQEIEKEFASLVWLRKKPRNLTVEAAAEAISRGTGIDIQSTSEPGMNSVIAFPMKNRKESTFLAMLDVGPFGLIDSPVSYFASSKKLVDGIDHPQIRQAIQEHTAWVSFESMGGEIGHGPDAHERMFTALCRVAAELADDDCLCLLIRPSGMMHPYSPTLVAALRSQNPTDILNQTLKVPVVQVDGDDPKVVAAVQEARNRFDEFKAAVLKQDPNVICSVKAPITSDGNTEFLWINVTRIEAGRIYGTLGNDPLNLPTLKLNDAIDVPVDDLNDWIIFDRTGESTGGFTAKLLMENSGAPIKT